MSNKKPNIIFILTDDQGAWAMHCAGNTDIKTPNLDRIARNGLNFRNFFCVSPVCSPARASILTGRIPSSHGVNDWIKSGNLDKEKLGEKKDDPYYRFEKKPMQYLENMTTYTDVLAKEGYTCALSGKWHLGDSMTPQHGFSKWFTIGRGGCMYDKADIVSEGKLYYETRYITDVLTDKALEYIDELGNKETPYYLSLHYTAPHDPWDEDQHPKEIVEQYRNCEFKATPDLPIHPNQIATAPSGVGERRKELLRGYYSAVTAMDANVGRILDHLEERGELEDTILIFTADNGMNMGHHGIWGKGNGTFPFNMFDTAVKVPFLISYPKKIKGGKTVESMHSHYDIFQTLLELAEIPMEVEEDLPGKSFCNVLFGKEEQEQDIIIYDEYGANRMIRTKDWKFIKRYAEGDDELYCLKEDPEEYHDLADDPEFAWIKKQMGERLEKWFDRYADEAMDARKEKVTGFGQLAKIEK